MNAFSASVWTGANIAILNLSQVQEFLLGLYLFIANETKVHKCFGIHTRVGLASMVVVPTWSSVSHITREMLNWLLTGVDRNLNRRATHIHNPAGLPAHPQQVFPLTSFS